MGTTPAHVAPRSTYGRCARSARLAIQCSRLLRAAGLCHPKRRLQHALRTSHKPALLHQLSLVNIGVAPPSSWGIGPGTPISVVHRWLRRVKVVVCRYSDATYHAALLAIESLSSFAHWQPVPNLHTIVYGRHVLPVLARFGGWRDAAIIVSVMGGRPLIEGMPPVHVEFVHMNVILCIMHYLNVMPIAFCVKGGKPAQHINHWICTFCSAPTLA